MESNSLLHAGTVSGTLLNYRFGRYFKDYPLLTIVRTIVLQFHKHSNSLQNPKTTSASMHSATIRF